MGGRIECFNIRRSYATQRGGPLENALRRDMFYPLKLTVPGKMKAEPLLILPTCTYVVRAYRQFLMSWKGRMLQPRIDADATGNPG
jgi:hypothetical protein